MQSKESEIILHRKKFYPSHWSIFWFVILLFLVMGFVGDIISVNGIHNVGWKSAAPDWSRLIFDGCQVVFVFLLIILPFLRIIRYPFIPSIYRISHEGISFPFPVNWLSMEGICYPIRIGWHEIKALCPYTLYPGAIERIPVFRNRFVGL